LDKFLTGDSLALSIYDSEVALGEIQSFFSKYQSFYIGGARGFSEFAKFKATVTFHPKLTSNS
jgi:hypothetical protein